MTKVSLMSIIPILLLLLLQLASGSHASSADDGYGCSKTKPCKSGCCGPLDAEGNGYCGLGPDFCGDKCTSNCQEKSECDPGWGPMWSNASTCPLNVCCSKYGFCGTTTIFCGDSVVVSPECKGGTTAHEKVIGYYEGWNMERPCGKMAPDAIPLGYYTHINFAFALIDPQSFRIAPMDEHTASHYQEVTGLKRRQRDLKVWIAIGGWAMNDPSPTRTTFSDLAASESAQDTFFESLISFMDNNGFDGVDIDWEYPVADDRGGKPQDFDNYVTLMKRLRERLDGTGRRYGVSITLPASYWYLRGFALTKIEPYVDWFNIMTYDIHGTWDALRAKEGDARAYAHTNLTEINMGLELLWRNNINPGRVVLGLGFYGRSFTMQDPGCMTAGCPFKDGGHGGECTGTPGVLSATEIGKIIKDGATVTLDKEAAVKMVTWNNDQWVSWDDEETLKLKLEYANNRCLGGTMAWAVDLDDGTLIEALGKAMGKEKIKVYTESELREKMLKMPDIEVPNKWDLKGPYPGVWGYGH